MEMHAKFYAVLSLSNSLCMVLILYVSRPFATPKLKKELKLFSSVIYSTYIFHSANHDADRRPIDLISTFSIFNECLIIKSRTIFTNKLSSVLSTQKRITFDQSWP